VFLARGVQKHHKAFLESPCQKLFTTKRRGKKHLFSVVFPLDFSLRLFAVSLHEDFKNAIKILSKMKPENFRFNTI
jgi:hypothetical protein